MSDYRRIPVVSQARVIVDNDWAADPDGLVALAHHLLAEAAEVRGIICTSIPFLASDADLIDPAEKLAGELVSRLGVTPAPRWRQTSGCVSKISSASPSERE